ncbi:MAG: CTP synthase, partial [Coriobacteriaceae bacterium]|nr:CTP synthase [Coriobacteriaceae bacterium]
DAYLSVVESLHHAAISQGRKVNVHLVDGETLKEDGLEQMLAKMDGILVPGGFGIRAFEGKIAAVTYARENRIPFLGICLGLHAAVCEFARNVAGMEDANSSEFEEEIGHELKYPVIDLMPDQEDIDTKGGTMRLGAYPCRVEQGTKAFEAYGEPIIYERHRHRYEVNNAFRDRLTQTGLVFSGISPDGRLVEMIELPDHPWFVASQGHPEFKSRPTRCHPLFREFIKASIAYRDNRQDAGS